MALTGDEVAKHNSKESCWVIVHGKAYDVTEFLPGKETRKPRFPNPFSPLHPPFISPGHLASQISRWNMSIETLAAGS